MLSPNRETYRYSRPLKPKPNLFSFIAALLLLYGPCAERKVNQAKTASETVGRLLGDWRNGKMSCCPGCKWTVVRSTCLDLCVWYTEFLIRQFPTMEWLRWRRSRRTGEALGGWGGHLHRSMRRVNAPVSVCASPLATSDKHQTNETSRRGRARGKEEGESQSRRRNTCGDELGLLPERHYSLSLSPLLQGSWDKSRSEERCASGDVIHWRGALSTAIWAMWASASNSQQSVGNKKVSKLCATVPKQK